MKKVVALIAALDTKGEETRFTAEMVRRFGCRVLVIDIGVRGVPLFKGDVSREEVAEAAGGTLEKLAGLNNRVEVLSLMAKGLASILKQLYAKRVDFGGILGLGGGYGTTLVTTAMQDLPLGFPKLMVSTVVNSDVSNYLRGKDIILYPSVTDIAGLNPILESVLRNASAAICALAEKAILPALQKGDKLIALTMFGITTPCVSRARTILESHGFKTVVFHANGAGGRTMEELIDADMIAGVLDITTTELADELVGGIRSAGRHRLTAAGRKGIPQVVCPGAIETVNFGPVEMVPSAFKERVFYRHTRAATLMRTNLAESERLGQIMAEKLNASRGPVLVVLPLQGFSAYNQTGQPFYDEQANRLFRETLKKHLQKGIKVIEVDAHLNDELFAERVVELFLDIFSGPAGEMIKDETIRNGKKITKNTKIMKTTETRKDGNTEK